MTGEKWRQGDTLATSVAVFDVETGHTVGMFRNAADARACIEAHNAAGGKSYEEGIRECVKTVRLLTESWRKDVLETSDPGGRRWEMTQTGERIERHLERLLP